MKLYDYYRSTASYRVRIALNLKNISWEAIPVHLINQGGEQNHPEYLALNPQGLVPSLDDHGQILTQSLAIIEYLEETFPSPALLPAQPLERAHIRSIALSIACDIHPLNNLRVLQQLKSGFHASEEQVTQWYHHWLKKGFDALESTLQKTPRKKSVCYGEEVSMADICLIPQVYNAKRFDFPMKNYALIEKINAYCLTLPAFAEAAPQNI
jgi:maleylacetoacetate isomerase